MSHQNHFDVVIVGAGPAGLMAATWMARTGVRTLVLEKNPSHTQAGHADGLESRTLEILDSFGIGKSIWAELNLTMEVCLWRAGEDGVICRDSVSRNSNPGLSRFKEATLSQGRIEEHMLSFVEECSNVQIRWSTVPTSLRIHRHMSHESGNHAIEIQLQPNPHADTQQSVTTLNGGAEETIHARYLIGCDGARSWVRKQLGLSLEAQSGNDGHWGVIDCVPVTDFPDIRKRCIIKSRAGSVMIIPRERSLVRFYIELSDAAATKFKANWHPSILLTVLTDVLKPYYLVTPQIDWSTIYTVGQRICKRLSVDNRVFLVGDAVHTHSPKAGQGMNVSMQDSYNLGWKLASVVKGAATPKILQTYEEERLLIAHRLIGFDRRMCLGICTHSKEDTKPDTAKSNQPQEFAGLKDALREENSSASGLTATYPPGLLVTSSTKPPSQLCLDDTSTYSKPHLAKNLILGQRLPDALVLCQSDSRPWHLQHRVASTGQWHLLVFGGDISLETQMIRVKNMAASLTHPRSTLAECIRQSSVDAVGSLATYLIHSAPRLEVQLMDLPEIFRPFHEQTGYEYWRVFADNTGYQEGCGVAYEQYGIGREGCMVLLRPDQHCAYIGELEDTAAVEKFFSRFML